MGVSCSRRSLRQQTDSNGSPQPSDGGGAEQEAVVAGQDGLLQLDWDKHQQAALERLRKEFNSRPQLFIISQMIMSVHFFKNFDRDKLRAHALKEEKEQELNRILRKEHKSAIYLGSPYELMGDVMHYERSADSGEALGHDLEYLILHDNVSVRSKFDPEEDSDNATYKFIMIPSRNPGYARLQQCGDTPPGSTCRPRYRAAAESRRRRARSASVTELDRSARPAGGNLSLRRAQSEDVLGEARGREDGPATAPVSGRTSTPAEDPPSAPAEVGDDVDSARSSRPSPVASGQSSGPGQQRGSDETSDSSLPSSAQRYASSGSRSDGEEDTASKDAQPQSKSAVGRNRRRGVTAHPERNGDTKSVPNRDVPLPTSSEAGAAIDTGDDEGETEKVAQDDQGKEDQASARMPVGWTPGFPPYASQTQYPAQYMPTGVFAMPMYHHGFSAGDAGKSPGWPGQFFQPTYLPPPGVPQPQYPFATPGYPYPAHPGIPYPTTYHYPLVPGTSSTSDDQAASSFPGHFGYPPPGGWQRPPENGYKSRTGERPASSGFTKTPRTAGPVESEVAKKQQRKSQVQQTGPDPHRKISLSELLRPEGASVCSEDSRGSFVNINDSTTDDDTDAPGHLPRHCFRRFQVRVDDDDDDQDHWTEPRYEIHRFLSSEIFVNHFGDHFGELARLMARDVWLQQASANYLRGPTIFCREQLPGGLRSTALVTPTLVASSWPEAALAWGLRERARLLDMERRMQYQWPPDRLIQELRQEGVCNLVPQGCFVRGQLRAARHFSPQAMAVEWEVCFQQADMRLINSLEAVHVHCWAVAKQFFTHFLSEFRCLQERHIRHLMFWQFERNIRDWRLEALGSHLVELLRSLERGVRERRLPHYFVPDRNLLESEEPSSLLMVQERLQRAMENPVPNVMIALSRLRVRGDAFPEFDWTLLFHYLTVKHGDLLQEVSPALKAIAEEEADATVESEDRDEDPMFVPTKEERRERDRQRQMRKRQAAETAEAERQRRQQQPRRRPLPAFANVSVKIHLLNGRDSRLRAQLVLDMFVRHFSAMATRLLDHGAIEQALAYADHALNLCQLLEEHASSEEAEEGRRQLRKLHVRAADLLPPLETDRPADADMLGLCDAAGSGQGNNWTMGPAAGRAARRDYNRQETADSEVSPDPDGLADGWQQSTTSETQSSKV